MQAKRGIDVVLSGGFEDIRVASSAPTGIGVLLQIFNGMPNAEQKPDAT